MKENITLERWVDDEGECGFAPSISIHDDLGSPNWNTFREKIKEDKIFDKIFEGNRDGEFHYVAPYVYWFKFKHSRHGAFSQVKLEKMLELFIIKAQLENFDECTVAQHGNHKELENYFFDDGKRRSSCALQLNENDWSSRLVECLKSCPYEYLQGWQCEFYGKKTDSTDFDKLQQRLSGISMLNGGSSGYAFHGAPDILITKEQLGTTLLATSDEPDNSDEPDDSDDTSFQTARVIENTKKPLEYVTAKNICMPQKLGQVVAQAHFLASAAFLQFAIAPEKELPSEVTSKALLIDKTTGGYHVKVVGQISASPDLVPVCIYVKRQKRMGMLSTNLLCEHIKTLTNDE